MPPRGLSYAASVDPMRVRHLLLALCLVSACTRRSRDEDPPAPPPSTAPPTTEHVLAAPPRLPSLNVSGTWATHSGPCNGRGSTDLSMAGVERAETFELTYPNGAMLCALRGNHCEGTRRGHTGTGWFAIDFGPDGAIFAGTWGYGTDHSASGTFTGQRGG